ncbi:SPOR domain-containing protein [Marimonas sp. MJW-29]|uniref:SPOR domain-containing protein n=1 Tax=Sulfitobacter sediminis TaxID=3234186 RepID=A0ABV3RQM5_9RHOB
MTLTRFLAILIMTASLGLALNTGRGEAQIREQQPAEFPPASYKGKQYVDSEGCVFIRAGIDGNVTWVPRVSRDRKIICGFRPSLAGEAPAAEVVQAPATEAPQITLDTPQPAAPTQSVKPAARQVAAAPTPTPAPASKRTAPRVVRQTPPKPMPRAVVQPPTPVPASQVQPTVGAPTACPGASALSRRYMRGSGVRCGPQGAPVTGSRAVVASAAPQPVTVRRKSASAAAPTAPMQVSPTTRIVPKHVAINRQNTTNGKVPEGYELVWDDDRLNPHRTEQNLKGRSEMLLVWTQTVPRRLINQSNGRDVTASVPLVYPYTSIAQQRRELGEVKIVQRDGKTVKRVVRNPTAYSSRSTPKQPKAAPVEASFVGKRYVQIGAYRDKANAERAARKIAHMGMRARINRHRQGGQTLMIVQAGPFAEPQMVKQAMLKLRGAGYGQAVAR